MDKLRFRQVHLDFHTSEKIENIGSQFSKEQFQNALQMGHVNSINIFSKCHHGWSYHPTKVNEMHPHLDFDLLGAELAACKEIGVRAPVYLSAGLDEKEAVRHPEWLSRLPDESMTWVKDFTTVPGYHLLCFHTGYLELLLDQVEEVMQNYHPEGIFLDIAAVHPCYCAKCRKSIQDRGKDIRDHAAVMEQAELVYRHYTESVEKRIRKYSNTCTIFHNAGHITRGRRDLAAVNTHLELESLPTGGWGYDHFPMSAAYTGTLGMEYLGMTGKFHTTWGEFGGFKHPNALRYEAALSLAFGAKCSIGDQMHPDGRMEEATYRLIGQAYQEVEAKEPWCIDARNYCDIGILSEEAVNASVATRDDSCESDTGANRIMLEGNYLYCFLDQFSDFTKYKLLILPDHIRLNPVLKERLNAYIRQGGKILASGESGMDETGKHFVLDFGVEYLEKNDFQPDYMIPEFESVTGLAAHVMYTQGYRILWKKGTAFAKRENSYFNRDLSHFSSHQHTPNDRSHTEEAAVLNGSTAYISWNVFEDYAKIGSLHLKEMVMYAIDALLGDSKTLKVTLPDKGVSTLCKQITNEVTLEERYIHHLLFAHTTIRGNFVWDGVSHVVEVIEDLVPLSQVKASIQLEKPVKRIYLAPQMEELPFEVNGNRIEYCVPSIECHQMVVIECETSK